MAKPREHNYLEYRNRIGQRHVCIFTVRTQICTFSSQIRNLTIHISACTDFAQDEKQIEWVDERQVPTVVF